MPSISRRRMLAASAGSLATLAGCSALGDGDDPDEPEPYRVGEVAVFNDDEESHDVDLLIRRDDEVVHWQTYELAPKDGEGGTNWATVPATEFDGCTPGIYQLAVRVDGDERRVFSSVSKPSADGKMRILRIYGDGEFRFLAGDEHQYCSSPTTTE
ncbi:hypothetical protein [Halomarina rubra]|uniref:Lipoprotein n=1 Tax=Halomarina rubra TaxID=2071873 RepID=A0ABD6AT58_9EURY|nr:hypothetical protein [Halomarina rubra]